MSSIPESYIKKEVNVMNAMRKDLMRLGFGPFSDWKQGTSGFHGILLLAGMCDHLSLYGITSFSAKKGKSKGPDQYGGRGSKNMASWVWHDWERRSVRVAIITRNWESNRMFQLVKGKRRREVVHSANYDSK